MKHQCAKSIQESRSWLAPATWLSPTWVFKLTQWFPQAVTCRSWSVNVVHQTLLSAPLSPQLRLRSEEDCERIQCEVESFLELLLPAVSELKRELKFSSFDLKRV